MYKLMLELEPTPEPKNFMKAGTAGQIVTHFPPFPPSPHCTCICTALKETSYVGVLGGGTFSPVKLPASQNLLFLRMYHHGIETELDIA